VQEMGVVQNRGGQHPIKDGVGCGKGSKTAYIILPEEDGEKRIREEAGFKNTGPKRPHFFKNVLKGGDGNVLGGLKVKGSKRLSYLITRDNPGGNLGISYQGTEKQHMWKGHGQRHMGLPRSI